MIARALLPLVVLAAALAPAGTTAGPAVYSGTITFAGAEPSDVSLRIVGDSVTVMLGPGHVAQAQVTLRRANGALRFAAPGLPKPLVFVLRPKGTHLVGTAVQGSGRAKVTVTRGRVGPDTTLGYYATPHVEITRFTRFGFSTRPLAIDADTGAFESPPPSGRRLDVHQFEVRIPAAGAVLAGTLTVPPGPGPHPALVYVSGSGPTLREESHWLDGVFVSRGIAVLSYDKRGNGQSSGNYPGDLATPGTIATLAGDAVAAARFLAAQTDIDSSRIGLVGFSQGGWIVQQAAVRAGKVVSWAVEESGPTVTQAEADAYASYVASGMSLAAAEAKARALEGIGYDPLPWIRRLGIPVLWLYGGKDRAEPPQRSMEILRGLSAGHDFTISYYPDAPHGLLDAAGFPSGLFGAVREWLGAHRLDG